MRKSEGPHLTEHGKRLYLRYVGITLGEYQEKEFMRRYLQGDAGQYGQCFWCGLNEPLIEGAFCEECIRGSWE